MYGDEVGGGVCSEDEVGGGEGEGKGHTITRTRISGSGGMRQSRCDRVDGMDRVSAVTRT